MNEAWHVFLQSRYKFSEFYVCRGKRFIESRKQVKIHKDLLEAGARSGFITIYKAVMGAEAPACRQAGKQKP